MTYSKHLLIPEEKPLTPFKGLNKVIGFVQYSSFIRVPTRFFNRLRRLFEFMPRIWNSYDWDHSYATGLFGYQLERIAKYLEKNKPHVGWEHDVSRIRTVLKLIDRVDNDYYSTAYLDELEARYGKRHLDFLPTEDIGGYTLVNTYEKGYTEAELDEIEKVERELLQQANTRQQKAKRILWKLIEHNIEGWWA